MSNAIFDFWSKIGPSENIHPADREVLSHNSHHFDLTGLPGSYMGPLRNAPVVLLYLNPGAWAPEDSVGERSIEVRNWHIRTRAGYEPLPDARYSEPTWRWWSARTRLFGDWKMLRSKVAFLNIAPYHSGDFKDYGLIDKLPSCIESLKWAHSTLFPDAMAKKRVVLCLRSARYWGLEVGKNYDGWLFVPNFTRSGHMHHGELREIITQTVRQIIET